MPSILNSDASRLSEHKKARKHAAIADRMTFWVNDYEGAKRAAVWLYDFKVILNQNDLPYQMHDLRRDQLEMENLLLNVLLLNVSTITTL